MPKDNLPNDTSDAGKEIPVGSAGRPSLGVGAGSSGLAIGGAEVQTQMFRSLADNSLEFIGMCDLAFKPFYVNEAGMKLVGLDSLEQACAVKVQDFFFPEDQRYVSEDFFPKVLREGRGEVEIRFRHFKTGAAVWVIYNVFQVLDAQGRVSGYATVSRNITRRKQAEEAVRSAALFPEQNPFPVLRMDSEGKLLFANRGSAQLLKEWHWSVGAPVQEEVRERVRTVLAVGDAEEWEASIGGRTVSFVLMPIKDQGYVNLYGRDVTEQKRAEEALGESEERVRLAVGAAELGTWDYSPVSGVLKWDARCKELFGLPPEAEVTYETFLAGLHPDDRARAHEVVQSALDHAGGGHFDIEYRTVGLQDGGTLRWVRATGRAFFNDAGRATRFVGTVQDVTERKLAEEALREERDFSTAVLETAGALVVVLDTSGRIRRFNRACAVLTGYAEEEVLGKPVWLFIPPEDVEGVRQEWSTLSTLSALSAGVRKSSHENHWLTKDGTRRLIEWSNTVLLGANGEIQHVIGTGLDITEQRRSQEALRKNEARWNAAIENFAEAAIIATESENIIYWNPAARRMHGFTSPAEGIEPLTQTPRTFELWTPDGSRLLNLDEWPMRRIKRGEKVHGVELRLRRPDQGWERFVSYSGTMVETAGEKLIFLSVHDLTEQREAEQALRESEEQFRSLADSMLNLAWRANADGYLTWYNRRWYEYTGTTPAEMEGWGWQSVHHPEVLPRVLAQWKASIAAGEPFEMEFPLRGADGRFRNFLTRAQPLKDAQGRVTRWFGTNTDITEQKRFQAELERLVAERTARLQELVGELEHFSYTITHDLKSPLRAMRGFAEIAAQLSSQGEAKPFLEKISTAAERMDRLIADALSYSRSVGQELPLEDVDAGALLRGILDSYPQFQPWKAQIQVEGRLPVLLGNEAGLTQCFSNLLGNAVKFVKPGEKPEIRVWATERGEWVRIWVEDKGIGISKEMLPRVFDMFARGSKDYEGTGIGLALVRKVVQRMGGRVGVESEAGKGSRFWIELGRGEAKPVFAPATAQQPAGNGAVLYVEDEESDAMFMERAFAEKGLGEKLRVVGTGRAAIDYLSGSGEFADREKYPVPALVLLDLNLPQVSGFGVLEWIRNHPDYARLPVVVFSSSTREDDRTKARELGANHFVAKPSSGLEFGKVVDGLGRWCLRSSVANGSGAEGSRGG